MRALLQSGFSQEVFGILRLVEELKKREEELRKGGGEEKLKKHKEAGKLTARERLSLLFDDGLFQELDIHVTHRCANFGMSDVNLPADGVVTAFGKVGGKTVYAFAQDATVLGGSLGEMHADKICRAITLALSSGAPFVALNDSGGARIQEGVDALNGYGRIFYLNTAASGVIPQISAIMGPCAGGAVYSPALTDFVLMVDKTSYMFITGPQVVKAVTGESVTFEELGGAKVQNRKSGVAHFWAKDDPDCIAKIRELLSYLPPNCKTMPPASEAKDPELPVDELVDIVPEDPMESYDVKQVITRVLDGSEFLEVHADYAMNAVVGFGRISGMVVGVVANQPQYFAGCLDINASDKIARFVRFCDAFNIPIITFVDTPGYLPGTAQEHGGIIRHGAKVLYAYSEASVPKISVLLRKAYGGAYIAMSARSLGADLALAWPTAEIAVMGPEAAAEIVFKREIQAAADPGSVLASKVQEYRSKFASPYVAASRGYINCVIDPRETRIQLIRALEALRFKSRAPSWPKHHGNFPV